MKDKIKVGIIEDHLIVLDGLKRLISTDPEFVVVFAVELGEKGIENCIIKKPDIVILDVRLPDLEAHSVARSIIENSPETKVICLSSFDSIYEVTELLRTGVQGYILKSIPSDDFLKIIKTVFNGGSYIDPQIASKLNHFHSHKDTKNILSDREIEILILIAAGLSNKQIGRKLSISEDTVKSHISNIIRKLEVNNRVEAIVLAIQQGIIDPRDIK